MEHIKLFEEFLNESNIQNGATYKVDVIMNPQRNYSNSHQIDSLVKDHEKVTIKDPVFKPNKQSDSEFYDSTGIHLDKLKYFKPEFYLNEIKIIKHNKANTKIEGKGTLLIKRNDVNPAAKSMFGYVETEGMVTGSIDNYNLEKFLDRVSTYTK
jgi:hypothetical protein